MSEVSSEVAFQLPNTAIRSFKEFFHDMDENLGDLEIKSYGIGVTTLEEVFLKVGDGNVSTEKFESTSINKTPEEKANDDYCLVDESVKGIGLRLLQLKAMVKARLKMTVREFRILFLEVMYPTILIVVAAIILAISSSANSNNFRLLSLSKVPSPQIVMYDYQREAGINPEDVTRFMEGYYNSRPFESQNITLKANTGTLEDQLKEFDTQIMTKSISGQNYFSVFIRDLSPDNIDVITLVDPTQNEAFGYAIQGTASSVAQYLLNDKEVKLSITRASFPQSAFEDNILQISLTMTTLFSYSVAMAIMTSSVAGNICKERADSIKHQQIVSGGSKLSYWAAIFIVDLMKFSLPSLSFIIITLAFNLHIPLAWLLNILCVISILPFTYFITFILQKEALARNVVRLIHIFLGSVLALIVFGLRFVDLKTFKIITFLMNWFFKFNPTFTFANALSQIVMFGFQHPDASIWNVFTLDKAGGDLLFLFIQFFFYWGMIILIENRFFINKTGRAVKMANNYQRVHQIDEESKGNDNNILDTDVQDEEDRVSRLAPGQLEVRAHLLNKVYKERKNLKHAVRDVSFGISFGECFALLGINGAGKTTTFKALTGDVDPTSGEVHIGGYDVQNRVQYSSVRKLIGYCPQFDALFTNLTVIEHLEFYAHIKGVISEMRSTIIERQLVEMGLEQYRNTYADKLSGGNKRKLSVAMAMIGNPPIVFLDEPSTGMDPKAKRFMWNIIAKISTLRKKSAVILTTHSMEEAEALSTKLGIMVDGQFKCYGSAQHIKNKFGDGYEVEIKLQTLSSEEIDYMIRQQNMNEDFLVTHNNVMQVLQSFQAQELNSEIRIGGLGDHMNKLLDKGGVKIKSFVEFIQVEKQGIALLNHLARDFKYIVLIEHYGSSFKVKFPQFEESLGILFGKFEEEYKEQYNINEYSISQTSLEQIFNTFAKQEYTLAQNSRIFKA